MPRRPPAGYPRKSSEPEVFPDAAPGMTFARPEKGREGRGEGEQRDREKRGERGGTPNQQARRALRDQQQEREREKNNNLTRRKH